MSTPEKFPFLYGRTVCQQRADASTREGSPCKRKPELSIADVQAIFARSRRTIRRWITDGYLTPLRRGRELWFASADIESVVSARLHRAELRRATAGKLT